MPGQAFPSFVDDLPITVEALRFATEYHEGQQRVSDSAPFILHPLEVAQLLSGRGYPDHVVAAGVLHDVVENTSVEIAEIELNFGPHVSRLVEAVSEPAGGGTYEERKARLRDAVANADGDAAAVFVADKIAKVREVRMERVRDPDAEIDQRRLDHYWACLELLQFSLGSIALVRQLRFELEALRLLPPAVTRVR